MRTSIFSLFIVSFLVGQQQLPETGVFPILKSEKNHAPGLHELVTPSLRQFVSLGPALVVEKVEIHGDNNANTAYRAVVRYSRGALCGSAVLRLDGVLIGSSGSSDGGTSCKQSFTLTRAQATRTAEIFKVKLQNRHLIGGKLRATFSVSPKFELILRIENPPDGKAVRWRRGGAQRGPRDNQFSMQITRNGRPLAKVEAFSWGGPSSVHTLKPGESVELRAPISSWGDISRRGSYVVEGAYYTALYEPGPEMPHGLGSSDQWDRRFQGTATFEVR